MLFDDAGLFEVVASAPVLFIGPGPANTLVVIWAGGGTLYQNTTLVSGAWSPVSRASKEWKTR